MDRERTDKKAGYWEGKSDQLTAAAQQIYEDVGLELQTLADLDNKPAPVLPEPLHKPSWWHPIQRLGFEGRVSEWNSEVARLKARPVDDDAASGVVNASRGDVNVPEGVDVNSKRVSLEFAPGETGPDGKLAARKAVLDSSYTYHIHQGDDAAMTIGPWRIHRSRHLEFTRENEADTYSLSDQDQWIVGEQTLSIDWKTRQGTFTARTNAHGSLPEGLSR